MKQDEKFNRFLSLVDVSISQSLMSGMNKLLFYSILRKSLVLVVSAELRLAPSPAGSGTPDCVCPHQPGCGPSARRQHPLHADGCTCAALDRGHVTTFDPCCFYFKAKHKLQELLRHHVFAQAAVSVTLLLL